jgi:membrane protein implicated in regulation of membrane protease activity
MSQKNYKSRKGSARIIVRYSLFQLPALALLLMALVLVQRWIEIEDWIFWGSIMVWIAKDVVLFFFTWRAYDTTLARPDRSMVGARGMAQNRLAPSGFIHVRGELWKAEVWGEGRPIEIGERVEVRDIKGLTLIVQPEDEQEPDDKPR